jgi:hypothetical protein
MPERVDVCGDCGAFKAFPSAEWQSAQLPAVRAWERQHAQDAHDGSPVSAWQLEPDPAVDRDGNPVGIEAGAVASV